MLDVPSFFLMAAWGCVIRMYQNAFNWFFNEGLLVVFIFFRLKQWGALSMRFWVLWPELLLILESLGPQICIGLI